MIWEISLRYNDKVAVYEYEHNSYDVEALVRRVFNTLEGEIIKIELIKEDKDDE